ncbi:MAG TPA: sigma 54-interacting transcriptional regulator [Candidatus Binatia bacterium]|nr:sigma 54-interacting transcriptional regulator [Candidatus Binatia bacterium]
MPQGGGVGTPDEPLRRALREATAELLRRLDELSLVRLVGDALAGEVAPPAIGRAVVTLLREEAGAELAGLWATDARAGGLRLLALAREGAEPETAGADAPLVPFSAGALGRAGAGEATLVEDAAAAPEDPPAEAAGLRALLFHPVGVRGRIAGVLVLGAAEAGAVGAEHERLLGLIAPAVAMALENAALYDRLAAENRRLRAALDSGTGEPVLVGASPAFRRMLAVVERLAAADITVLVLGASGTGKELVARALHHHSPRRAGPFVAVNCAALPDTLLESELFGIERGVATGVERRPGLVERAAGGTLFLDEVGDMSLAVQAKVLRVLQEREVVRVGGGRPLPVDVRVIAATHQDLERGVREGRFREDLYFRLKVASVHVPALAERVDDVPLLAQHFLARFAEKHGRPGLELSSRAVTALVGRAWPGNIRELANAIEHAVVLAAGPLVEAADLGLDPGPAADDATDGDLAYRRVVPAAVDSAERAVIQRALVAAGQNRTRAARLLGIGRRTLLYKLKRYGLR